MAGTMRSFFIFYFGITCVCCRAVDKENKLLSNMDFFKYDIQDAKNVKLERHQIKSDGNTPNFMLKSMKFYKTDYLQESGKITSVHHFGRHYLCDKDRARFYRALRTSICNTNSRFIYQLISRLCGNKGKHLDIWVAELFDLTGDGYVNHYERSIYDKNE